MRILGIDEAGRGPVIGPMVVAAVLTTDQDELRRLDVRDSKALSRKRRGELAPQIARVARVRAIVIPATELEENLNDIELGAMTELIGELAPELVYFDVPAHPRGVERFRRRLRELIGSGPELIGENHADNRWPVVAAASIIAKVRRDEEVLRLREKYGDFGWGYPSEPKTREFLERWYREHGDFPPCVRRKWKTARRLVEGTEQR
ncbi:MAG: ribonuclease HII [Candidatus Bipolaricaulia bacterium]